MMAGLLSAVELLKVAAGAAEEAVEMEIERRIDGEGLKAAAVKSESSVPWVVAAAEVVVVVAAGVREAREQLDGVGSACAVYRGRRLGCVHIGPPSVGGGPNSSSAEGDQGSGVVGGFQVSLGLGLLKAPAEG
ncbi:hypothetical protein CYMTET_11709 [Cymbomonas tetramitiformis]|uniref:Uncharacterized protein n=1 Tax=Cymbomonas tetramitiformis TaxID=36881 RepID=A0AAE0LCS1_9CHLO|nr:hypothetical protein CYMTET_11709 [Cymbomonas tetramitiformis]